VRRAEEVRGVLREQLLLRRAQALVRRVLVQRELDRDQLAPRVALGLEPVAVDREGVGVVGVLEDLCLQLGVAGARRDAAAGLAVAALAGALEPAAS